MKEYLCQMLQRKTCQRVALVGAQNDSGHRQLLPISAAVQLICAHKREHTDQVVCWRLGLYGVGGQFDRDSQAGDIYHRLLSKSRDLYEAAGGGRRQVAPRQTFATKSCKFHFWITSNDNRIFIYEYLPSKIQRLF